MDTAVNTELGVFPASWRIDRFDSIFDVQQGKQVSKANRIGVNQRAFLRTKNVLWNRLDLTDLDEMHFSEAEELRFALKPNDLLICEGGDIGRTAIWRGAISNCYYQNHLHRARIRDPKSADASFVHFWLWYAFEVSHLYFGRGNVTTIPNLSQSKLCELPLPIPPLLEQRKIASVLGLLRQALEYEERLIEVTVDLKKSLRHKLFSEGVRRELQKETEIGLIPSSWDLVKLGDECELGTGTTPATNRKDYYVGNVPFVKTADITNNRIDHAETFISEQALIDCRLKLYPPGTILMAMYGQGKTRGQVGLLELTAATTQNAGAIQPSGNIEGEFLWQWLMSRYEQLRGTGALGHISHLNLGYLRDILVPKPSLADQRAIVTVLRAIDSKIAISRKKQGALHDLFLTTLHQLMTAQIRVQNLALPDIEPAIAA
jgi:type I restriction enzyme, S subunit